MPTGITDGIYAVSLMTSAVVNIHDEFLVWPASVSVNTVPFRASVGILANTILPNTVRVTDFGSIGTTNDSTVVQAAFDGVAEYGTVIFPRGTYTIDLISVNKAMTVIVEKGAILKYKSGASNSTSMINVLANDVTFEIQGEIDGNRNNQSGTGLRAIHSLGYHRVRVDGCGRQGYVYGVKGHAIWLRNGNDPRIVGMRCDSGSDVPFFIEGPSADLHRPEIEDCWVDLSGEGAIDYGCIKIQLTDSSAFRTAYNPVIKDCWAKLATNATNVPIEMWAGAAGGGKLKNGRAVRNYAEGGAIALSIDHGEDCIASENIIYNSSEIGLEIVSGNRCAGLNNNIDGNGRTLTGISIDNQTVDGKGTRVFGNHISGCVTRAIWNKGSSTYSPLRTTMQANNIDALVSNCHGIECDPGHQANINGNTIVVSGAAADGITLYTNSSAFSLQGNNITAKYVGIILTSCLNFSVDGNILTGVCASDGAAYKLVQCNQGKVGGGVIAGQWLHGCQLIVDTSTMDFLQLGGWHGIYGSLTFTVNGGAFGDHITSLPINGWQPFGIIHNMSLHKAKGVTSTWVIADGAVSSNPNSVIDVSPASRVADVSNGTMWTKVSGTGNTGWKVPQATSVNT